MMKEIEALGIRAARLGAPTGLDKTSLSDGGKKRTANKIAPTSVTCQTPRTH